MPVFLLGLLAMVAVWAIRPLWYDPELVGLRGDLEKARSQLQDAHAPLNALTVLLNDALNHIGRLPDRAGETHFLLGSTYLRLAEQLPAERAPELWRKARVHLEQAEQLRLAESDRVPLRYRLAKAWFHTGGDAQRIIDYLKQSIEQVEDDRATGYEILTQCYLRLPIPNLPAALQANDKELQQPTTPESRLVPARLLRGELLLRMQQRDLARKVLIRIDTDAPPAMLARARSLRARSYQEEAAWAEAASVWEEILADRRQPPTEPGQIFYWLGCCYRNLHRPADAVRAWESAVHQPGEEGQAAGLRLANVEIERDHLPAGLKLYDSALADVRQPADYHNRLVPLADAVNLLASDCRGCKDAGRYEEAAKLAQLFAKLAPPGPAQTLAAQVAEAWAQAHRARAQQQKDVASALQEEQAAQSHSREAAAAYEAAARTVAGQPEEGEWHWRAGACAMQGRDFQSAIAAYQHFVKLRPSVVRLSEAYYHLGEAHQAVHEEGPAAAAYQNCIQTDGPQKYLARFQLAVLEMSRGNARMAEEMLDQILTLISAEPEPDREAQAKTLYAVADLLYARREFALAAERWEQALRLYPVDPSAPTARFRLARCYRSLADRDTKNAWPATAPDIRSLYGRQFIWLEKAEAHFQKLVDDLQARQAAAPLSEADVVLFRQVRFALADCRFDERHYAEAVPLYIGLANQHPQQVDSLVALRQLYRCYLELLTQAKPEASPELVLHPLKEMHEILNQLDDSAFQGRPETENRSAWERWLKEEEKRLHEIGLDKPAG
ncbi:MAG TPA: tetratricopeptide repeat protein [Gemmataceae bacterium]|nr:tetratricopeptide repeat protein [Gemmataceae bacterium]